MEHSTQPKNSFPRQARLTRARDFEQVLRRPEIRISAGPLRLNALFNRMHCARLGLVVGKKAVARASARNRIKRVIRESFRRERCNLAALDLVVRVVGPISRPELHRELERLWAELQTRATKRQLSGPDGEQEIPRDRDGQKS